MENDLIERLLKLASELSEKSQWFSMTFDFGSVSFEFDRKASEIDEE